jgi:hypothetical protein
MNNVATSQLYFYRDSKSYRSSIANTNVPSQLRSLFAALVRSNFVRTSEQLRRSYLSGLQSQQRSNDACQRLCDLT